MQSLKAAVSSPSATIRTMVDGLSKLGSIYDRIDAPTLLQSTSSQRESSSTPSFSARESFVELKVSVQDMQLALKRGDGADLRTWVQCYTRLVKKAQKMFKKANRKTASDVEGCRAIDLVAEAREVAVSILESTLHLLSKQIVLPSSSMWSLVSKSSFHKKSLV
jgi:tRNA threonylcarbamoyladenosine modification (KEOPS) complex  Pcc1 subunit|uniref:Uncharacterized protein n=1 Tax=Zea mays TaxID=4577 RepID=A0A804U9S2_MAIZE